MAVAKSQRIPIISGRYPSAKTLAILETVSNRQNTKDTKSERRKTQSDI